MVKTRDWVFAFLEMAVKLDKILDHTNAQQKLSMIVARRSNRLFATPIMA